MKLKKDDKINVCGWSMGGYFSYYATFFGLKITNIISAGSCFSTEDLLKAGRFVGQGHFVFQNLDGFTIDMPDIIDLNIQNGTKHYIVFGENDRNCLFDTVKRLERKFGKKKYKELFELHIFPKTGHQFTHKIKDYIFSKI